MPGAASQARPPLQVKKRDRETDIVVPRKRGKKRDSSVG